MYKMFSLHKRLRSTRDCVLTVVESGLSANGDTQQGMKERETNTHGNSLSLRVSHFNHILPMVNNEKKPYIYSLIKRSFLCSAI